MDCRESQVLISKKAKRFFNWLYFNNFKQVKKVFYSIIIALLLAVRCNINDLDFNNLEGPTITSNTAIPIGNVTYTMRELIEEVGDSQLDLQEDSSTLLYLVYRDTAEFNTGTDIINIANFTKKISIPINISTPGFPRDTTICICDSIFNVAFPSGNNDPIDSVFYKQGQMSFQVRQNPVLNGLTTSYVATVDNTREVSSNNAASFSNTLPTSIDLSTYKNLLKFENDSNRFELDFDYQIFLPAGSAFTPINIEVEIGYSDQEFDIIYGRFGQDTIAVGGQVLEVSFFEDLGNSGFVFGNPTFAFEFVNSFGLPLGILFEGMYGVDGTGATADTTFLTGDITNTAQVVDGATVVGEFANTTLELNSDNSNIRTLLERSPNVIGFDLSAIANPEDASAVNFVEDNSLITTYIEATLPMEVQLNDLSRDIDFSLGGGLNFSETDSLTMRIISINEIPFSVLLDLEIYDENDTLLYIVANHKAIDTPFLNLDGSLKQPRKHIEDVPLDEDGITALNNGSRLNLRVTINTPESVNSNDIFVKILADYKLDIQVSAVGTLKVNL